MAMLRRRRFWLGGCLSLLCLWLAARNIPFAELSHTIASARYIWLLPAIALQLLAVVTRAQRWVVLLGKDARLADSFWAQGVGYLFTNVLPLRMGEPARVIIMAERCTLPIMQVAASAIVERLLDVATIVLALILVLPWMQVPALVNRAGMSFGMLTLLAFILLLCTVRFSHRSENLLRSTGERLSILPTERIVARWRELVDGLVPLTRRQIFTQALGWSLVSWAFSIAMYWCVLRSLKDDGAVVEAAFMVVALSLAVTVPSSPGFVGVFQLVGQQALVLPFGTKYDAAQALAITLLAHLTYYLLTTTLGILGLWQLEGSFANVGRAIRAGAAARKVASRQAVS